MCQLRAGLGKLSLGLVLTAFFIVSLLGGAASAAPLGVYAGGHETPGMGGMISYTYSLELKEDSTYELKSYFVLGDALYEFIETGAYQTEGSKLVLTPAGAEPIEGTINGDGSLTVAVQPSQMARARTESTLRPSTLKAAGVYRATFQGPTTVEATLYLDHLGGYYYLAVPGNDGEAVHESGTYTEQGGELTLTTAAGESFAGSIAGNKVKAPFIVSKVMGMRIEIELEK